MICLSIDSSTSRASVALQVADHIDELFCPPEQPASLTILPLIQQLLRSARIKFSDLQLIAVAHGPGTFTGVRLACTTASALSLPYATPIITISSLSLMANSLCQQMPEILADNFTIVTLLNAQMHEIYCASYASTDILHPLHAINLLSPTSFLNNLPKHSQNTTLYCGNALSDYPQISEILLQNPENILVNEIYPTAKSLAQIACRQYLKLASCQANELAPLYIRNKVAQTVAERLADGGKA